MEIKGEVYTGGGVCLLMVMVFERGQDTHIARHVRAFINVLYILSLYEDIKTHAPDQEHNYTHTQIHTHIHKYHAPSVFLPPKKKNICIIDFSE